jgi:hypothetical protein
VQETALVDMLNCRNHLEENVLNQLFSNMVTFIVFKDFNDLSIAKLLNDIHLTIVLKCFHDLLYNRTIGLNVLLDCERPQNCGLTCFWRANEHLEEIFCTFFGYFHDNLEPRIFLHLRDLFIAIRVFLFNMYFLYENLLCC